MTLKILIVLFLFVTVLYTPRIISAILPNRSASAAHLLIWSIGVTGLIVTLAVHFNPL